MDSRRLVTRTEVPDFEYDALTYDGIDVNPRGRIEREANRRIRDLANLHFFGDRGILWWLIREVGRTLVLYTCYCGLIVSLYIFGHISVPRDILGLQPGFRPYLVDTLQFLAAFLAGFGVSDAAGRFKSAMAVLVRLKASVEKLRAVLLANTNDPKLRFGVQALICWCMVLLQKQIAFFREDYSVSIGSMIPEEFRDSVLFDPAVLWSFDRPHAEVIFVSFLSEAKLFDGAGQVMQTYKDAVDSWTNIEEMLQVRAPGTKHMLGHVCVSLFLVVLPICNDDLITVILVPFAAGVFFSILQLAHELSDPWGIERHDLPLSIVLQFLCMPVWGEDDVEVASGSLMWLNSGLGQNEWTWTADHPIPRTKERGASKGKQVNFEDYRSLPMIAGYKTYEGFLQAKKTDMEQAESRGRRMPDYLRWRRKAL